MAKKKVRTLPHDPRYLEFAHALQKNPLVWCEQVCDFDPSFQQADIIQALKPVGANVSVASGHGTGKSHLTACLVLWYLLCHKESLVMLTANNIEQVRNVVFAYIKRVWARICELHPWLEPYCVITSQNFYVKGYKGVWQIMGKTCSKGNEESLAGNHRAHYLIVVDEASGVSDKAMGVMRGALTEADNRMLMLSQPTRNTGHFYESHYRLAKSASNPNGIYTALALNSELSPFVTDKFIREKRQEYGGVDAPEYCIKVRGIFPDNLSGYLISRKLVDTGFKTTVTFSDEWGYLALCDVAGGEARDSSVLHICKVSGMDSDRIIESVLVEEMPRRMDGVQFARYIHDIAPQYPNITFGIDSDGYGLATAQEAERLGVNVHRIHWGRPPHSNAAKKRFTNERTMSAVYVMEALRDDRIALYGDNPVIRDKTIEQFVRIPYSFNERGQWKLDSKEKMRGDGIKSPDIFDSYAFAYLLDYIPAGTARGDGGDDELDWANELLEVG